MYIYNYLHIWRAARNVQNPPANNNVPDVRAVPAPAHTVCVLSAKLSRQVCFVRRDQHLSCYAGALQCRGALDLMKTIICVLL